MKLRDIVENFQNKTGKILLDDWETILDDIVFARLLLERLNSHFFQIEEEVGISALDRIEYQYLPAFHKYWETHHPEIINARIDRQQARLAARALHEASRVYGSSIFDVMLDTHGLPDDAIAQVRFFTANQDFRKPSEDQFGKYLEDHTQFDKRVILDDPARFLDFMGISSSSQTDKRLDYAKHAAEFLMERDIIAYEIAAYFDNDAKMIRDAFLENVGMGYGRKKTDMFIRDMAVLGVWPELTNLHEIDVASDRNTMKLALRTQILQTDIPLLSSFLDIFGYQYGYTDSMSAAAWRAVWEEWQAIDPATAPSAPCMMDFILYRIGREYCDDKLVEFVCENGHNFFYFGAQKKLCVECRAKITPVQRILPCQAEAEQLPRYENGALQLNESNLLRVFDGRCIFESTCRPKSPEFRKLSPPKAISIIGRTGWTESYAYKDEGGGGMMG